MLFRYSGLFITAKHNDRNPYLPGADLPGALGKGQAIASALGNFFKFWAYASTIVGAVIAGKTKLCYMHERSLVH